MQETAQSSSTASPPTMARRSPRTSSTGRSRPCGTRPRTACTPRRRCWRSSSADGRGRVHSPCQSRARRRSARAGAGAAEIAIVVEDENREDPVLFGWYDGLGPTRDRAGALPDRIVTYRLPLVESFHDPEELRREIRTTVLHEVGHSFGLDERRIEELGYG